LVNPVFIEVTRGRRVESFHRGALAVVRANGDLVCGLGDVDEWVFPRSSIKALQCMPLVQSGAADAFGFGPVDIALACGSHVGSEDHASHARSMLERLDLSEEALACGVHTPLGARAAKELWRSGREPTQFHNNCSGKHVGMLATALHLGEPIADYFLPTHPVQKRVHDLLEDMTGIELGEDTLGLDGCSVPNWARPLNKLAGLFASVVSDDGRSARHAEAAKRIMAACWQHPVMVAGRGRADTLVMDALPGRVFMKTGAEGVYAGAFPALGLGFALKIDDGTTRASAGSAMALIEAVLPEARGLMARREIKTWRGLKAGEIRASEALLEALRQL